MEKPKPCPDCGGDGGWEIPYAMDHVTGTPLTKWRWCQKCNPEDEREHEWSRNAMHYFASGEMKR